MSPGLTKIYRPGFAYKKAGVVLMNLRDAGKRPFQLPNSNFDLNELRQSVNHRSGLEANGECRKNNYIASFAIYLHPGAYPAHSCGDRQQHCDVKDKLHASRSRIVTNQAMQHGAQR